MSQRFNFLLQVMLVALLFSVVSVPGYGQFRGGGGSQSTVGDQGGNGEETNCIDIGDLFYTDLFFKYSALNQGGALDNLNTDGEVDFSNFNFGCNLFVGVSVSGSNQTLYTPLANIVSSNFVLEEVNDVSDPLDPFAVRVVSVELELELPTLETSCTKNQEYEFQTFTLNLYCLNGESFEEVDACEMADLFILSQLDEECSLAKEFDELVCCSNLLSEGTDEPEYPRSSGRNGICSYNEIMSNLPNIHFGNNEMSITSNRNESYEASYRIINLSGQLMLSGGVRLMPNEALKITLLELPAGIYILAVNDNNRELVTKKIVKK